MIKKILKNLHFRELLRGGGIAFAFKLLSALASYFFIFFIAQLYGADGVGVFTTSWTILMIASVIAKLGFDTSIVRFIASDVRSRSYLQLRKTFSTGRRIIFISALLVGLMVVLLSKYFAHWFYDSAQEAQLVRLVGLLVIPFSILLYQAEGLKGLKKITAFSLHHNAGIYILSLVIMLCIFWLNPHLHSSVWALGLAVLVLLVSSYFAFNTQLKRFPQMDSHYSEPWQGMRSILKTTLPMMLGNSLFLVMNWTDVLMLGIFSDDASVGVYNVALKIAALNAIVLMAVNSIAMPKYAELYKTDTGRFRQIAKAVSFMSVVIALPVFLVMMIFPKFVLQWFGSDFVAGDEALVVLAVGQIFSAFCGSTIALLNMTGKERTALRVLAISVVLNLAANYFLIPKMGILGAAYATAGTTILVNILAVIKIYRFFGFVTFPIAPWREILGYRKILFGK